jgi:hypothetical protein
MLLLQDARGQRLLGVLREHRHRRLGDDRTMIELRRDEMDRAAMDLHPFGQSASMRMHAWKRR